MSDISLKYCGLDSEKFRKSLIETRSARRPDELATEFAYFYVAPMGTKVYSTRLISNPKRVHSYLLWPNGTVVDLVTSEDDLDLTKSILMTSPGYPGTDTQRLAEIMGFSEDDLDLEEEDDG